MCARPSEGSSCDRLACLCHDLLGRHRCLVKAVDPADYCEPGDLAARPRVLGIEGDRLVQDAARAERKLS